MEMDNIQQHSKICDFCPNEEQLFEKISKLFSVTQKTKK